MNNVEFFETVIHTDKANVPDLKAKNAAQFLMKMASLGANVFVRFTSDLQIIADTPLGQYWFIFSADESDLDVEQVL